MKIPEMMKLPLLAGALAFASSASGQTILVRDTFTLGDGTGTSGAALHGTPAETYNDSGSNAWKVTAGKATTVFSADGTIITKGPNGTGYEGRIAISNPTTGILSVSASVTAGNSDWIGIGFATSPGGELFGNGALWVFMRPSGTLYVFRDGTSTPLAGGLHRWSDYGQATLGAFDSSASYTLTLKYDTENHLAQILVSDGAGKVSMLSTNSGWFSTGASPIANIGAAAFKMNARPTSTSGSAQVDNFEVTVTP